MTARKFRRKNKSTQGSQGPENTQAPEETQGSEDLSIEIQSLREGLEELVTRVKTLEKSGREYISDKTLPIRRAIEDYEAEIKGLVSHEDRAYAEERTNVLERRIEKLRQQIV